LRRFHGGKKVYTKWDLEYRKTGGGERVKRGDIKRKVPISCGRSRKKKPNQLTEGKGVTEGSRKR